MFTRNLIPLPGEAEDARVNGGMPWYVPLIAAVISSLPGWVGLLRNLVTDKSEAPRKEKGWRFWIVIIFPLLAWASVGFDYYDRHQGNGPSAAPLFWHAAFSPDGRQPPTYTVVIDVASIQSLKDKYKVAVVVRNVSLPNIDPLYDTAIEKSAAFAIEGPTVQIVFQGAGKIKFALGQSNQLQFLIVLLPIEVSPDEVTRVADIKRLNGMIVGGGGQIVVPALPAPSQPMLQIRPGQHL